MPFSSFLLASPKSTSALASLLLVSPKNTFILSIYLPSFLDGSAVKKEDEVAGGESKLDAWVRSQKPFIVSLLAAPSNTLILQFELPDESAVEKEDEVAGRESKADAWVRSPMPSKSTHVAALNNPFVVAALKNLPTLPVDIPDHCPTFFDELAVKKEDEVAEGDSEADARVRFQIMALSLKEPGENA